MTVFDGEFGTHIAHIGENLSNNTSNNENIPNLSLKESVRQQSLLYLFWLVTIAVCMTLYYIAVGFRTKFTLILGVSLFIILMLNMIFSGIDKIDNYTTEVALYDYVEANARSFLPFGIALAALVLAAGRSSMYLFKTRDFLFPLLLGTVCFVFVLTIIWMPKNSGYPIRVLRDVKTAVLTLGGVTVIALVGEFVVVNIDRYDFE